MVIGDRLCVLAQSSRESRESDVHHGGTAAPEPAATVHQGGGLFLHLSCTFSSFADCVLLHVSGPPVGQMCRLNSPGGTDPVLIGHLCVCVCFSPEKLQKKSCCSVTRESAHVGLSNHSRFPRMTVFFPPVCVCRKHYVDLMRSTQTMTEDELHSLSDKYNSVYLHPVRTCWNEKREKRTVFAFPEKERVLMSV